MKIAANFAFATGLAVTLFTAACNYAKPVMYVNIENRSGHPIENLEVKHPTGIFGLPELRDAQTHRHMLPIGSNCQFNISFEDQAGKKYNGHFDFGAKCPTEVALDIGTGMGLSERVVRP